VEEVLQEYGISIEKVFRIVTDNGSNVMAAFKDTAQGNLFRYNKIYNNTF
jgi:hypothetical protein